MFRLKLCGSAQLSAKIEASCEALLCLVAPFVAFPFSAYTLPRLRSLQVYTDPVYYATPLRLRHRPPLPPAPIPSLTSLKMRFSQSLSALPLDSAFDHFPNLLHLELDHACRPITQQHLSSLPRGLLSLILKSSQSCRSIVPIPYSIIAQLPRPLETLIVQPIALAPNPETLRFEEIDWPPNLKELTLRTVRSTHILH